MQLPAQNRNTVSIVAALTLGLSAIYTVPYLVPVHDGLSFSYMLGYSNRTATLLILFFIALFAVWTNGLGLTLPGKCDSRQYSFSRTGYLAVLGSALGALLLWLFSVPIFPLAESQYFLDRYEMFRLGFPLYRGFEFDYGPIMFYLPVIIARVTHLSIGNSYFVALIFEWALGTWILWKTVQVAARGTSHGRTVFLLIWFFFLTSLIDSGPNYTPLRFCPSLAFAIGVHHLYRRGASMMATFGLASVGAVTMLFFSPEQGISFTAATLLFFLVCVRAKREKTAYGLASFVLIMMGALYLALRTGVLDNIRTVGGGALNFPVLFSLQNAFVLLLITAAGCAAIASFRNHTSDNQLVYLICLSFASAPAAFSRADFGHIIINMLGALIGALIIVSQYDAVWRWTWITFASILAFFAFGMMNYFRAPVREQIMTAAFGELYHSAIVERLLVTAIQLTKGKDAKTSIDQLRADYSDSANLEQMHLPSGTRLLAPIGIRRRIAPFPDGIEIITGRYPWLFPMTSTAMLQEKIGEIETHPNWPLILPEAAKFTCVDDPRQARIGMKKLLQVPYMPKVRRSMTAAVPFCDYLNAHYVRANYASPVPGYYVWIRENKDATSPQILKP